MAVEIGTATGYLDLYTKLFDFLTGNADLVASGQNWTLEWGNGKPFVPSTSDPNQTNKRDFVLRGPGLAGGDNVYVGFRWNRNDTLDHSQILLGGMDAVVNSARTVTEHVNVSDLMRLPMLNGPMPYWFVANGRRFVVVIKNSTSYASMHGGLLLASATPANYPYPMAIGGSSLTDIRWSTETHRNTHFVNPGPRVSPDSGFNTGTQTGATLRVRMPNGDWRVFGNNLSSNEHGYTFPYTAVTGSTSMFSHNDRPLLGGGYLLTPIYALIAATGASQIKATLGAFQGIYHVPGFSNFAENTVTIDGKNYLVVQNAFRNGFGDYWALLLE